MNACPLEVVEIRRNLSEPWNGRGVRNKLSKRRQKLDLKGGTDIGRTRADMLPEVVKCGQHSRQLLSLHARHRHAFRDGKSPDVHWTHGPLPS